MVALSLNVHSKTSFSPLARFRTQTAIAAGETIGAAWHGAEMLLAKLEETTTCIKVRVLSVNKWLAGSQYRGMDIGSRCGP